MTGDLVWRIHRELDTLAATIRSGSVEDGAVGLQHVLDGLRRDAHPEAWRTVATTVVQSHPVLHLIHESPFSRRAFEKPRGYAGDAHTLDLAYRMAQIPAETTATGRRVSECELESGTCRGIRARLDLMVEAIDQVAGEQEHARILSVACGHMREAQRSRAVAEDRVAELIAFDQDEESLRRISSEQPRAHAVQGSVRAIVTGAARWADLDFIYSAGLYDYLSDRFAAALTQSLFSMLRPGGRLLLANMTPETNAGYLEACMDWWMTYRDEEAMCRLADVLPSNQIASSRLFRDHTRHIVFLELRRA